MATQQEISAVVDLIIQAFEGDINLFKAWLNRSRKQIELAQLESEIRKETASMDMDNAKHQALLIDLANQIQLKTAEIDDL